MTNFLLLRFRDILQNTVDRHNDIIKSGNTNNRVLWGWWKKRTEAFPQTLCEIKEHLDRKGTKTISTIFFINSDTKELYKANLFRILLETNMKSFCPPEAEDLCPKYYNETELYAWFEVGEIQLIRPIDLEDYVFSTRNSTYNGNGLSAISKSRISQSIDTTDFSFLNDNISLWFICNKDDIRPTSIKTFPNIYHKTYATKGCYILHLSDLHFGSQHAYAIPNANNGIIGKQTLIDSICRDLLVQKISLSEIALILITGDITCTANAHEFNEATRFIEEMKQRFNLGAGQIVCVPGNHDVEWIDKSGVLNEDAELNYRNFSRNIYNCEADDSLIRINEFLIDGKKVAILGLNSCRVESRETAGIGYIGAAQMQLVEDFINSNLDLTYKIALLHHHLLPVNYTEAYSNDQKNVSILLDSEALMQTLISCKVQTVLHGHQHQPYFSQIRRFIPAGVAGSENGLDGSLNIVGGGSVGTSQAYLNSIGRNTYQLLKFVKKDENSGSDEYSLHVALRVRNSDAVGYITGWETTF